MDFHPTLPLYYVLNELTSTLCVVASGAAPSADQLVSTINLLPKDVSEGSRSSDVKVTADGRFLYAIHREPRDEVVALSLDEKGMPSVIDRFATGGSHARTMALTSDNKYLLTANRKSEDVTLFRRTAGGGLVPLSMLRTGGPVMSLATIEVTAGDGFPVVREQRDSLQDTFKLMTYNVRYGTAKDGEHHWDHRGADLVALIREQAPDILGLQEALSFQLKAVGAVLPNHRQLGRDRNGGDADEHSSLCVNTARFEVLDHGQFWLGADSTAMVPGFDAALPRIAVWAALRDLQTKRELLVVNTHFDHRGSVARTEAAKQIAAFVKAQSRPAIVMGDFNADETSPPMGVLRAEGFRDSHRVAHQDMEGVQTFTDFKRTLDLGKIDGIFIQSSFDVLNAEVIDQLRSGRFPSDHLPVTAVVRLP
jgi:endonuclease/exonuclease/phosphatase family metal-dependent hydrolase